MAAVLQSELKAAFLLDLYEQAKKDGFTLSDAIRDAIRASVQRVKTGAFITAHTGGGHSTAQAILNAGGMSPSELVVLFMEYRTMYDRVVADLAAQTPSVSPASDDQIFTEMMDRYRDPVKSTMNSFLTLRYSHSFANP